MQVYELLSVGMVILLGLLGGKLSHRIKIPRVTGYMLVGLVFGPSVLTVMESDPEMGQIMGAVVLSSVIVYEGVGPFLTRMALARSGEIHLQE